MRYASRRPDLLIDVKRHDFTSAVFNPQLIFQMSSKQQDYPQSYGQLGFKYPGILSYEFTETVADPSGEFSITVDVTEDSGGMTILDVIKIRDLVYISEFGTVRFVGIVSSKRYASAMGENGDPQRSIVIVGYSIGGLIAKTGFVLDQFLMPSYTQAGDATTTLMANLAMKMTKGSDLSPVVAKIVQDYSDVQKKIVNGQILGVQSILDSLFDYKTGVKQMVFQYPMHINAYQLGVNTLWTTLQQLFPPPVYELFGYFDDASGKYILVARIIPFSQSDWSGLPLTTIDPVLLQSYDIGCSDEDVYSAYLGMLPGAMIDKNEALALSQYRAALKVDMAQWQKFGYKPMYIERYFFDFDEAQKFTNAAQEMEKISQQLLDFYKNNDRMYSGTVTIMNYEDKSKGINYPRAGGRLAFVGGEFYIESVTRTWEYGGPMKTIMQVNRGWDYKNDQELQPGQRIKNLEIPETSKEYPVI